VFRRRRRDGEDGTGLEAGDAGFPADDELIEEDYDTGLDPADEYDDDDDGTYADLDAATPGLEDEPGSEGEDEGDGAEHQAATGRARRDDLGDPDTWTRLRDSAPTTPAMLRSAGPWDSASEYPAIDRIDFGSLLVPVREGYDVQVFMSEEEGISIAVVRGDSGLQLQPFAAPRSAGLWHEVLPEIAEEVDRAGDRSCSPPSSRRAQASTRSRRSRCGSSVPMARAGSCAASLAGRPPPMPTSHGRWRTSSPTWSSCAASTRSRSASRWTSGSPTRHARC
jgi:hypothetical protein